MANRVVVNICGEEYTFIASKAQSEVSELKREIFRLQQRLDNRNKG